jgi:hypothetical protein
MQDRLNWRLTVKKMKKKLRARFQSETDIKIVSKSEDWDKYAEWLEDLNLKEINTGVVKENDFLRKSMEEAFEILKKGIEGAGMQKVRAI